MNNVFYHLQFCFRQKHSTSNALIDSNDKIREQLEKGNFTCKIFVDLQNFFGTVDHDILIQKLNHYGIRRVANNCFFFHIFSIERNMEHTHCGAPQGSILGPLLFLIYINDLNCAIRYCSVHHFADDTNLLNYSNSVKRMNKQVNQALKNLTNWLNANKISLNVSKAEVVLFKSSRKLLDVSLNLKPEGKRLYPTNSVKYIGINIDGNLTSKQQISDIAIKLNKAIKWYLI